MVVEGVRVKRLEPWFRKPVSIATRLLVFVKTGNWPQDANTPFRAYSRSALVEILEHVPEGSAVPNLHVSVASRNLPEVKILPLHVVSLARRGRTSTGSTWGRASALFPNRRFIRFCMQAAREWLRPL
jgi:hypothetical protein